MTPYRKVHFFLDPSSLASLSVVEVTVVGQLIQLKKDGSTGHRIGDDGGGGGGGDGAGQAARKA